MKVGVFLPLFRSNPRAALESACKAEARGIDGVFVFDHLFSFGEVSTSALSPFPVLAAVAIETGVTRVGTLVSRVGVVAKDEHLAEFIALQDVCGPRLIAGLGIGGRESELEHVEYGVPMAARAERLVLLEETSTDLIARGVETWIGGRSSDLHDLARRTGATINLWGEVGEEFPAVVDALTTWAGSLAVDARELSSWFIRLADYGFDWAVVLPRGIAEDPSGVVDVLADAVDIAAARGMHRAP